MAPSESPSASVASAGFGLSDPPGSLCPPSARAETSPPSSVMPPATATPADVDEINMATTQANINRYMSSLSSDHRPRLSSGGSLGGDAVKVSKCLHGLPVDPGHRKPLPCSHPHTRARSTHWANSRRVGRMQSAQADPHDVYKSSCSSG